MDYTDKYKGKNIYLQCIITITWCIKQLPIANICYLNLITITFINTLGSAQTMLTVTPYLTVDLFILRSYKMHNYMVSFIALFTFSLVCPVRKPY